MVLTFTETAKIDPNIEKDCFLVVVQVLLNPFYMQECNDQVMDHF